MKRSLDTREDGRFFGSIDAGWGHGCHIWTGWTTTCGYGGFYMRGKQFRAHRLAWEIRNGPIPDGRQALHQCDRPLCVNPEHIFLGTAADNVADRVSKGRSAVGERNGGAKLSAREALEVRDLGERFPTKQIGEWYGVTQESVRRIITRRLWRHLEWPTSPPTPQQPHSGSYRTHRS